MTGLGIDAAMLGVITEADVGGAMLGIITGAGVGGAMLGIITGAGVGDITGVPAFATVTIDARFRTRRDSAYFDNIAFFIKLPRLDNLTIEQHVLTKN